jgi:hypothetical protein
VALIEPLNVASAFALAVVPLRDLTVDQATADYPAICFNRRKMEADRKALEGEEPDGIRAGGACCSWRCRNDLPSTGGQ